MANVAEFSEARRALLEKYLRGDLSQAAFISLMDWFSVKEAASRGEQAIAIQSQGSNPPFFFLHGDWTGNPFFCFALARHLGTDQPFYSIDPYSFDGLAVLPSVKEIAATHIRAMRSVQAHGPYFLGGFCRGGLVAYEMARQLNAAGQKTALLVLIDALPPRLRLGNTVMTRLGSLLRLPPEKQLQVFLRLQHAYRYLRNRQEEDFLHLGMTDSHINSFFPPIQTLRKEYPAMFAWATAQYEPGFYAGKVTHLWDEEEPERRAWWQRIARGKDKEIEMHIIPGTHKTCKTEHISAMAQCLRSCLSKARV